MMVGTGINHILTGILLSSPFLRSSWPTSMYWASDFLAILFPWECMKEIADGCPPLAIPKLSFISLFTFYFTVIYIPTDNWGWVSSPWLTTKNFLFSFTQRYWFIWLEGAIIPINSWFTRRLSNNKLDRIRTEPIPRLVWGRGDLKFKRQYND